MDNKSIVIEKLNSGQFYTHGVNDKSIPKAMRTYSDDMEELNERSRKVIPYIENDKVSDDLLKVLADNPIDVEALFFTCYEDRDKDNQLYGYYNRFLLAHNDAMRDKAFFVQHNNLLGDTCQELADRMLENELSFDFVKGLYDGCFSEDALPFVPSEILKVVDSDVSKDKQVSVYVRDLNALESKPIPGIKSFDIDFDDKQSGDDDMSL